MKGQVILASFLVLACIGLTSSQALTVRTFGLKKLLAKTHLRTAANCKIKKQEFKIELRGIEDVASVDEIQNGSPFMGIRFGKLNDISFFKVSESAGHEAYSFFEPMDQSSVCDLTAAYLVSPNRLAVFFNQHQPTGQSITRMVLYDLHSHRELPSLDRLGYVTKLIFDQNSVIFSSVSGRTDIIDGTARIFEGRFQFREVDLEPFYKISEQNGQIEKIVSVDLSWQRGPFHKFFLNEAEFKKATGWSEAKNEFQNTVVFLASELDRDDEHMRKCVTMVRERIRKIPLEQVWYCNAPGKS